jgi:ATP-binding protein involved in chromosome partitioning
MAVDSMSVEHAVHAVVDEELGLPIDEVGMAREVEVRRHRASAVLALPVAGWPGAEDLRRRLAGALEGVDGIRDASVDVAVMGEEELATLRRILRRHMTGGDEDGGDAGDGGDGGDGGGGTDGHAGAGHSHGHTAGHAHGQAHGQAHGGASKPAFLRPGSRTRVIGVSSGKGGVGKSSVTVNLAVSLAQAGHRVGVLDADVYGFSIPKMLGAERDPIVIGDMVLPAKSFGIRVLSIGFFVEEDTPVIWRGPMLHKAIEQFLGDAYWGEPDFLLVDMPPGTGDVTLSLAQVMTRAEVLVVTTPQPAAQRVAQRSAYAARKLKLSVRGVVENMSWFTGDDGTRYELFGRGGGQALAEDLGVPLLGQVPLVPALREGGDEGMPIVQSEPDSEAAAVFHNLASTLQSMGPARVYRRELTIR